MLGGIEAGGTKFICLVGTSPDDIRATERIEVADPSATLPAAIRFFRGALDSGLPVRAIGIGSFGPLELRHDHPAYGWITRTPKPGWSGVDLVGPFREALGLPIGFDTDVNAAALGEGRWGAARGLRSFVYLTVGTGIGGGAVVEGRVVHGLGHPEMGHVAVPRHPGDDFAGACPFHGACLEGMASGTAIAARFGRRAETLAGPDRERAVELAAFYLAAGVRTLTYALAPERVVVGGGMASMDGLLDRTRTLLGEQLAGYPGLLEHDPGSYLVAAGLGAMAGPAGTLVLAEAALASAGLLDSSGPAG